MKQSAAVISLGCAKNLVDSEMMVPQLARLGYSIASDPSEASLLLVNTCGFLESAVEEAVETILKSAEAKALGSCECLVVTGCMVQRYGRKLLELLPEVDIFLGTSHYHRLEEILQARQCGDTQKIWISPPRHLFTSGAPRLRSTAPYSAYLKIAEGCSNRCSFCMIPRLRGPYRSRTVEDVLHEASLMDEEGVKEINLIAQDTTAFGSDRGDAEALTRLLERMDGLSDRVEWVRLLYAYPDRITVPLLRTMARSKKTVPYLDIPFQHCAPRILKAMRREGSFRHVDGVIDLIRSHIPETALRTSLIVGFPGETESEFQELVRFVERTQFDHVGVFAFSPEAGSRAARLPMQLDEEIKEDRRLVLLETQRQISRQRLKGRIGQILPVLIEGVHPETELLLTGRLATQAPEVDGTVIITSGTGNRGELALARITGAHDYDLEAELLTLSESCFPGSRDERQFSPARQVKRFDI